MSGFTTWLRSQWDLDNKPVQTVFLALVFGVFMTGVFIGKTLSHNPPYSSAWFNLVVILALALGAVRSARYIYRRLGPSSKSS
jgi:hypothetical protein